MTTNTHSRCPAASRPAAVRLVLTHTVAATAVGIPWPVLLAATFTHHPSALGLVGASRSLPYLALSWLAGWFASRVSGDAVYRRCTHLRVVLLAAAAVVFATGQLAAACVLVTLSVAAQTPAFPTLAAAAPALESDSPRPGRVTSWLVTGEVAAYTAGPAIGGVGVAFHAPVATMLLAAAAALVASLFLWRARLPGTGPISTSSGYLAQVGRVVRLPRARSAIVALVAINASLGALGVGLLPLVVDHWDAGPAQFGLLTAALGFGALGGPAAGLLPLAGNALSRWLVVATIPLAAAVLVPSWGWALPVLGLLGAFMTQAECAATVVLQEAVPGSHRVCALGIADTCLFAGAMAGAATAPWVVDGLGVVSLCGLEILVMALAALTAGLTAGLTARPRVGDPVGGTTSASR